jgi:hypothetical protein
MPTCHWNIRGPSAYRSSAAPMIVLTRSHVKPVSTARKATRQETPLDSPRVQRDRGQSSTAWAHHHPKSDAPGRIVRDEPEAIGTPHEPVVVAERPAPQHTGLFASCIHTLSIYPSTLIRGIWVLPPQASSPFRHVATQLMHTIRADPPWKPPNRAGGADSRVRGVGPIRVQLVAPRIDPPIASPRRFLPLGFTRQGDLPALLAQQACKRLGGFPPIAVVAQTATRSSAVPHAN